MINILKLPAMAVGAVFLLIVLLLFLWTDALVIAVGAIRNKIRKLWEETWAC